MKIKDVFLSAILTTVLCFSGNLLAYSGDGDGTTENPYQISSVEDWQELMAGPNDWSSSFILMADVNLAGVALTPVGNISTKFTGVFYGNDNVISNAEINLPSSNRIGLFGYVGSNGQIQDLGVENINVTGDHYVGGLVGSNGGSLTDCYTNCLVSGNENIGGLLGLNLSSVMACYASGSTAGLFAPGGLVGVNTGTVTACYATGSVSSERDYAGGLVGVNTGTVTACYATGSVSSERDYAGGLVGWNENGALTDCYAEGAISGTCMVGGLVGITYDGLLTDCYATGSVTGTDWVGGLVGSNFSDVVTDCFWDIETTGQTTSSHDGGTGKSTVEMKTLSTFTSAGWDMINVWDIGENQTYPFLRTHLPSDIDKDDETNLFDLAILAQNWMEGI